MANLDLTKYGITGTTEIVHNPSYEMLFEEETKPELTGYEKGQVTELGAVNVMTGVYTGRSPKDKYIVVDENSKNTVWWTSDEYKNDNHPASEEAWAAVKEIAKKELSNKRLYVVDAFCGANKDTRMAIRFIVEVAWQAHFVTNMFIKPTAEELANFEPDFVVYNASKAKVENYKELGLNSETAVLFNITSKEQVIVNTWYGGEMKKGMFSMMNYFLPLKGMASMHCSANTDLNGENTAIFFGLSGTGKTTLLNMLTGRESCDGGSIRLGPSVKWAYLEQVIHFDHPERNLVDTMLYAKKNITPQSARNRLAAYQFQGEDVFKSVSVLSGGELSRLRLCMLMDEEINFLILDEPTNHLDIASREWVEEAVEAFDGTLLFVSHDRYFINRFATRIWELADGTITDYPMGFAQYRATKAAEPKPESTAPVKKGDTRQSRGNRSQLGARRQLTICETAVAKLEKELAALDEAMAANACDAGKLNELFTQKQETEARLEQEMSRWEELSLALEES